MNEELKIIIKAVTQDAQKSIQGIKKELDGVSKGAKSTGSSFSTAMKGFGKAAGIAISAVAAVGVAIVALGKKTLDLQKTQAKLNTAFQSVGMSAAQAAESYKGLFRFLGDNDTSVEAAAHLAKMTTNQKELAEWTKICQGVYASWGDSLKTEALTESANETARVGKVTGAMADALNWAGVSEDEFNAKLAKTTSFEEREALIRSTLNGLYGNAAEIYEKNNKALLEHNESQARVNQSLARTGATITPLLTALNNLSAALLDALKPALDVLIPAIATVVDWLTKGMQAVMGFFGVITGASTSVNTFAEMGSGISSAANGAGNLASGLEDAAKAAEKAKKATMGFDELNIVSSGTSSSSSGTGDTGAPGYMAPTVDASKFTMEVEQTENKASGFANMMKKVGEELKDVFAPTITAWTSGFETIKESWNKSKENFKSGASDIMNAFKSLGTYVLSDFVPSLVNSFSTNLAPMITDVFGFAIEETGKNFKLLGGIIKDSTDNIIIPALDSVKNIYMDVFEAIGDSWSTKGQPIMEAWTKAMDHVRKTLQTLYDEFVKPILEKVIAKVNEVWASSLEPAYRKFVDAMMEIGACLLQLYNEFIAPIVDWIVANVVPVIKNAIDRLIDFVGDLLSAVGRVIGGMIETIKGIVQFITGVFTGDWQKAWEGIKNIFNGQWETIKGIAEAAWVTIKNIFNPEGIRAFFSLCWKTITDVFAAVDAWFKNMFNAAWEGIKNAWKSAPQWFADVWATIKNTFSVVSDWFTKLFTNAWNGIKNSWSNVTKWFSDIWKSISTTFKDVGSWFTEKFTTAWNGIKNAWSGATKWFSDIWTSISNTFSGTATWFKNMFGTAWTNVSNAWSTAKTYFSGIWTSISNTFSSVGTWFKEKFTTAWNNVSSAWSGAKTYFTTTWNNISGAFSNTGSWFKTTFTTAYTNTTNAFANAKTGFTNVWNNIKSAFGNVSDWFKTTFTNAWTAVKNVFSTGGKIFDGIKDGILNGLKVVINGIIDGINKVIKVPFDGINSALSSIRSVNIAGVYPFSWLPSISVPQIPRLAKGGIIDEATLALIGESGKEAVVPLENNTEWIDKLVDKLAARQQAPSKIVLMLDGKELGWANINSINNITRQTGALQLVMA